MASSGFSRLACMALLCLVVASSVAEAVTCGQVASALSPCINLLEERQGPVPAGCCNGIRTINNAARTTPDRQTTCRCLKSAAAGISGINYGVVAATPGRCGVSIPYKISPSTNCNSVK
ncbi:hypothetical protein NL676_001230 [Syzygium grande]|nr:hypothetical protein NL676_001230 [Syzygium grande]